MVSLRWLVDGHLIGVVFDGGSRTLLGGIDDFLIDRAMVYVVLRP